MEEQKRIVAKLEEILPEVEEYGRAQEELNALEAALPGRLRKSLLQEAVEGRLVPQNPDDEPAAVLLQRIRAEKARLIQEGKIKKQKPLPPITDEEKPFPIPPGWEWVRLNDISYIVSTQKHQILLSEVNKEGKIPVVSQSKELIEGYSNDTSKCITPLDSVVKLKTCYNLFTYNEERAYGGTSKT